MLGAPPSPPVSANATDPGRIRRAADAPRNYQIELAKRAIESNIIAVADTGSGKTMVAVILLKHMVVQARNEAKKTGGKRKMAFFVVDRVPLVTQQYEYIHNNSDIALKELCGSMGVDSYSNSEWGQIFEEHEAIVLTGQILYNILQHAFWKIEDCCLIIFDECHHAVGDHNYRLIMREFYEAAEKDQRPKIFGMTASPPKNKGPREFEASYHEKTLHSTIVAAPHDEIIKYVKLPEERCVRYVYAEGERERLKEESERDCANILLFCRLQENQSVMSTPLRNYEIAVEDLGPWGAKVLWEYSCNAMQQDSSVAKEDRNATINNAAVIVQDKLPKLKPCKNLSNVSPKIRALVDVLREYTNPNFCGIVFVQRRVFAHVLCHFIEECNQEFGQSFGLEHLKPVVLTGHVGKNDYLKFKMQLREQKRILQNFRKGDFNLLIATDVAEEGLDIRRCNLVIRFDVNLTLISFIQARGRARDMASDYVILQDASDHRDTLTKFKREEQQMRDWCNGLIGDRISRVVGGEDPDEDNDNDYEDMGLIQELAGIETVCIDPETGARLTFTSAIGLLSQYCDSLPSDIYTQGLKPKYQPIASEPGEQVYQVTLPPNAPASVFVSDALSTIVLARRSAAFKACKELHRLGVLTNRWLPFRKSSAVEDREANSANSGTEATAESATREYPVVEPKFWDHKIILTSDSNANQVRDQERTLHLSITVLEPWLYQVDGQEPSAGPSVLQSHRKLALLTKETLPQFDPIELFSETTSYRVEMKVMERKVELAYGQVQDLEQFTQKLFYHVHRKDVDVGSLNSGMRFLVAPLRWDASLSKDDTRDTQYLLEQAIDWADVTRATTPEYGTAIENSDLTWDRLQDLLLFEPTAKQRFYYPVALRKDLTPLSPIPVIHDICREKDHQGKPFSTMFQFDIRDLDQPIIQVTRVERSTNMLQTVKKQKAAQKKSAAQFLIPEHCMASPIAASVLHSAKWMVSVLTRLDGLLMASEFKHRFGLHSIQTQLILEALTASNKCYAMNFQRLEHLGDTFLKLMVTVDLFIRFPLLDEGSLTRKCSDRVNNQRLLRHSRSHQLGQYLIQGEIENTHFSQSHPRPPQKISNKTMADLIESTLGAAFLSGGLEAAFETAMVLLDPLDGIQNWADFATAYENLTSCPNDLHSPCNTPRSRQNASDLSNYENIEESLGYRFKDRLLLKQALTHASWSNTGIVGETGGSCYQRLEFLGDALLGMLVTDYCVKRYPNCGPGILHKTKTASVNFKTLGVLSITSGFHRHIIHFSPELGGNICSTVQQLQDAYEAAVTKKKKKKVSSIQPTQTAIPFSRSVSQRLIDAIDLAQTIPVVGPIPEQLEGEFWVHFDIPKVLGDVFESILGAIYIDSGWDYAVLQRHFDERIKPFLEKHISDNTLTSDPLTTFTQTIQAAGCQNAKIYSYNEGKLPKHIKEALPQPQLSQEPRRQGQDPNSVDQTAVLVIHDKLAGTAMAENTEKAKKILARDTVEILRNQLFWLDDYCTCPKRLKITLQLQQTLKSTSPPEDMLIPTF
ncbi:Dicer-like protein 1 [Lunasporangiospora selenospora]|uniref:Dicer-like protein 1 n=1 Tax=Lunasporangiospora selenospora TaxID=979761 RepID=A0A9P6FZ24_9FUNG|nr:Dicer-like protein 1 [Lunasporangiospora selenospora]